jgi:hypothetical protein
MSFYARIITAVVSLSLVLPSAAHAQSTTRGWILGGQLFGASLDAENSSTDGGGGLGISVGYGFRNRLSLLLSLNGAGMNAGDELASDYVMGIADFGARYTFRHDSNHWRPFVTAAISGFSAVWDNVDFADLGRVDVEVSGPALTLGGGIQYFTSPRWAFEGAALFSGGTFDQIMVENVTVDLGGDDTIDFTAFRLQLGGRYYFKGRKH